MKLRASYHDIYRPPGGEPLRWSVEVERVEIDPFFFSLANPFSSSDREEIRLNGLVRQGPLAVQTLLAQRWDGLESRTGGEEARQLYLSLNYAPGEPLDTLEFLGVPSWRLIYDSNRHDPQADHTPRSRTRNLQYRVTFRQDRWRWEAGCGLRFYGLSDRSYLWQARTADLKGEGRLGSRLILRPGVQIEQAERAPAAEQNETVTLSLKGDLDLVPKWLHGRWDLSLEQAETYAGALEQTMKMGGELIFNWRKPRNGRPGFDLSLRGTRSETRYFASSAEDQSDYRIFLGLKMTTAT